MPHTRTYGALLSNLSFKDMKLIAHMKNKVVIDIIKNTTITVEDICNSIVNNLKKCPYPIKISNNLNDNSIKYINHSVIAYRTGDDIIIDVWADHSFNVFEKESTPLSNTTVGNFISSIDGYIAKQIFMLKTKTYNMKLIAHIDTKCITSHCKSHNQSIEEVIDYLFKRLTNTFPTITPTQFLKETSFCSYDESWVAYQNEGSPIAIGKWSNKTLNDKIKHGQFYYVPPPDSTIYEFIRTIEHSPNLIKSETKSNNHENKLQGAETSNGRCVAREGVAIEVKRGKPAIESGRISYTEISV